MNRNPLLYRLKQELGSEVHTTLHFLFDFIDAAGLSRNILENHIPEVILNQLEYLSNKNT